MSQYLSGWQKGFVLLFVSIIDVVVDVIVDIVLVGEGLAVPVLVRKNLVVSPNVHNAWLDESLPEVTVQDIMKWMTAEKTVT